MSYPIDDEDKFLQMCQFCQIWNNFSFFCVCLTCQNQCSLLMKGWAQKQFIFFITPIQMIQYVQSQLVFRGFLFFNLVFFFFWWLIFAFQNRSGLTYLI